MSKVTDGFEEKWGYDTVSRIGRFPDFEVKALLAHARALEAMLRKHEMVYKSFYSEFPDILSTYGAFQECPECGGPGNHSPDCELARLIE